MIDREHTTFVQMNNLMTTFNLMFAIREMAPDAHLLKLGTMGEYGTPNVDIPEGFFEVDFRGRKDWMPFPRQAPSWYHWSKVHGSNNIMFACKIWGMRATDVMQGVVFGTRIDGMAEDRRLRTRLDFDQAFGTVINRFACQAVIEHPLTPYGLGGQVRGFLPLSDSMQCLTLSLENPPDAGEYRVFNQFEETYSIRDLADVVQNSALSLGLKSDVASVENPRAAIERQQHHFVPDHDRLRNLGYQPTHDLSGEVRVMLEDLLPHRERIAQHQAALLPDVHWGGGRRRVDYLVAGGMDRWLSYGCRGHPECELPRRCRRASGFRQLRPGKWLARLPERVSQMGERYVDAKLVNHTAPTRRLGFATTFRRSDMGRSVARTAGFNVAATAAAGLGGVILARAFGPTLRGDYAAITAWFTVVQMVGAMGQPAALCYYVARDPLNAPDYVATSRALMLATGTFALLAGILLAPLLAHGNAQVTFGYRIVFGASLVTFVGASYTFALQARDLHRWNVVRLSQPVLALIVTIVLWRLRLFTLETALLSLAGTLLLQLGWSYRCCRQTGLAPGRARAPLVRPLAVYGVAQIAASTPALLNTQLDQLVLSQTVPPADLGRYAIAVTLTTLPIPLVAAIGNVAFPRLAAQSAVTSATLRLQRVAVLGSAGLAAAMLAPLALTAYWLVPLIFGAGYRGAVPLLWILTPGALFLACGQVVGDLLRGRKRPIFVAWAQGLAAVFTVILLLALLPLVGVAGGAIASTVAYGISLAAMLRYLWGLPREGAPGERELPVGSTARGRRFTGKKYRSRAYSVVPMSRGSADPPIGQHRRADSRDQ